MAKRGPGRSEQGEGNECIAAEDEFGGASGVGGERGERELDTRGVGVIVAE